MTGLVSTARASTLWIVLLTVASTLTTLIFACATPFPALAALAALHMRQRDGLILMLLSWFVSQVVGFGLLGYPRELETLAFAMDLLTAALGSALAAYAVLRRMCSAAFAMRLIASYVAAFVAFKLVALVWAFFLGGIEAAYSVEVLMRQFARNGAILLGLLALYHLLVRIGLPAAPVQARIQRA
ncbi:hypothetical protein IAG41_02985 [Sphingomonas sp. JC676]|uniref:hypothetical protein n=1 Tax=Sphingomonas sp. JC676 TaxID=2768065 RepID=UPI0016578624|nr:hypothetical protein [Sphingomonas sp. JC676]MBC9031347.1 hypothetical protein [Sphingomonas sp. JC676]